MKLTRSAVRPRPVVWVVRRFQEEDAQSGMTTAEYAVGTIAACGFAGVLYRAITSPEVLAAVKHVVVKAFEQAF